MKQLRRRCGRNIVFMRFCDFTLEVKPDGSTVCRFRKRLNKAKLLEKLLEMVNSSLETLGLKVVFSGCDVDQEREETSESD